MDIINSFISETLLDLISGNIYLSAKRAAVPFSRSFCEVDTYLTWAERRLDSLSRSHLEKVREADTSLEKYYTFFNELRTNAAALHEIRGHLEEIFPFLQRMPNAEQTVLKYVYMLETLYDTLVEERTQALPVRARRRVEERVEPPVESQEPEVENEAEPQEPEVENEAEPQEPEVEVEAEPQEPEAEVEVEPQEVEVEAEADEDSSSVIAVEEQAAQSDVEESNKSEEDLEEEAESPQPRKAMSEAKKLGIIVKGGNSSELIKSYNEGTIDPKRLTCKGLRAFIQTHHPSIKMNARMGRKTLLSLITE
jgi:hypothetical protein